MFLIFSCVSLCCNFRLVSYILGHLLFLLKIVKNEIAVLSHKTVVLYFRTVTFFLSLKSGKFNVEVTAIPQFSYVFGQLLLLY